jgi:hypothetical protein
MLAEERDTVKKWEELNDRLVEPADRCATERTARDCAEIVEGYIGCDMIAQYIRMKYIKEVA